MISALPPAWRKTIKNMDKKKIILKTSFFTDRMSEVNTKIQQLEKKHDLLQYKIGRWCVWPLLRFRICFRLEQKPTTKKIDKSIKIRFLFIACKDFLKFFFLPTKKTLIFSYSYARREVEGNLYKDIFFDNILLQLNNFYKIESVNNYEMYQLNKKALIKSDITSFPIELLTFIMTLLSIRPKEIKIIAEKIFHSLEDELEKDLITKQEIIRSLSYFYWGKIFYKIFLSRIKPQRIFVPIAGEYMLVAAAKELGIKTFEFQHGVIDRNHYSYTWTDYALPYKNNMPIADKLLLYGEFYKKELDLLGFWGDSICVTGNPRVDIYRGQKINKNRQCTLLFTSQGIEQEKVCQFFLEFITLANKQLNFLLYIKLHPANESIKKNRYTSIFRNISCVRVIAANEPPSTFELIKKSHLHLSISSTTHFEALSLGTITIILPFFSSGRMLHLCDDNCAFNVTSPQELLNLSQKWEQLPANHGRGEYFNKQGAITNILNEINS